MIPSWENHFGKITAWSLIYFLNYSLLSYLVQLQILVISLYFFLCIQNGCSYCVYLRKCVRLDLQTASLGLVKTFQDFGFLTLEIFSLSPLHLKTTVVNRAVPPCRATQSARKYVFVHKTGGHV